MIGRFCAIVCLYVVIGAGVSPAIAGSACQSRGQSFRQTHVWVPPSPQVAARGQLNRAPATPCPTCVVPPSQSICDGTPAVVPAAPCVHEVERVETVMTSQVRYETYQKTIMQPVYRTVSVPVTVPVQTLETMVGTRRVLQHVPVRVQRPVTTQCYCVQTGPYGQSVVSCGHSVTQLVDSVETRPVWVDQQYTFQAPVTSYVTEYQPRQVLDYEPTVSTIQVPVTVQVPVTRVWKERVAGCGSVPGQVHR